ncbi:phosphatidylinositol-specific phospholipase C [Plectosphaerella plurivora]|uniref:Phosphatidylinositol-specific phospholipase C n=1 Tax=Plectosphaerella plurivora TaxID=936078 RepID=A0A9P8VAI3_9PEZI|nr:phosphatidylinositol-specific phospholipase C [Plectosphaerella plurivora]
MASLKIGGNTLRQGSFVLSAFLLVWMLFSLLLGLSPCLLSGTCYHGYDSRYSFDVDQADHASWMKHIPDETNLTSLSIPGTHDTLTYDITHESYQCQNHDLRTQMRAGMRYLDIRGRLVNDTIQIYHASRFTGYSYGDVLLDVFDFLEKNPSETIVMRLKDEARPYGHNLLTFEGAFNWYMHNSSDTAARAKKHFWPHDPSAPLPSLGALRGKIFLLQNFRAEGGPYGIAWSGPSMDLEDLWIIPSVELLSMKWEAIEKALIRAANASDTNDVLHLSHLSASVGVLPIVAAAGPINGTVVGMNDRTGLWLDRQARATRYVDGSLRKRHGEEEAKPDVHYGKTGIVIIDFPGRELVEAILERNKALTLGV